MKKILTVILVFLLSLIALPINSYAKGKDIILNDKTGIPDKGLYQAIQEELNYKKSRVLTKKAVAKLTFLNADNYHKNRPDIKNLKGIEYLKRLKGIGVSYNKLKNLSGLEKLENLEVIRAADNNLTSITAIENLTELKELNISHNQLKGLSPLENLINLERLDASYNVLTSLSGIEGLVKLKSLDVSGNKLKSISGIEGLTDLETLGLNYNKLTSLKGVENLLKLWSLTATDNKLRSLPDLSNLVNLDDENTTFVFNKLSKNELKKKLPWQLAKDSRWIKVVSQLQNTTRTLKLTSPSSFKKIKSTTSKIKGTAHKNAKVRIRYKDKTIKTVKTNNRGVFEFTKLNLKKYKGKTLEIEVRHKAQVKFEYFTIKYVEFKVS